MGNQQGKDEIAKYDVEQHGTRETIAAWHRKGVSVWDVYECIDVLGQGHMGTVYRVRRKDRGVHNSATRQRSLSVEEDDNKNDDKTPKMTLNKKSMAAFKSMKVKKSDSDPSLSSGGGGDKTPKAMIKKAFKPVDKAFKPLVRSKSGGASSKSLSAPPPEDEEDRPPEIKLAEPPSSPPAAPAKSILKKSHYSNPTLSELPSLDDEPEDEEVLDRWAAKTKDRVEHIQNYREEILQADQEGALKFSYRDDDPLSEKRKVFFKRNYACKTVLTSRVKDGRLREMMNEIYVMRSLDHPYILKLYEIYQGKRKLWLVTELCTGGDLTSRRLMEPEVAVVLEQILRALAYMHGRKIVHSDLKLENVLFESKKMGASIRLIDFGLSKTYDRAEVSRKAIGTAYTLSPEIVGKTGKYTSKTDIWSLGVVAWVLLTGDVPFIRTEADLEDKFKLNRLLNAKPKFGIAWQDSCISNYGKTFVEGCLKKNPDDRWTAKQALEFVENTWIPAMQEKYKDEDDKVIDAALKSTVSARRQESTGSNSDFNPEDFQRFCSYGQMKKTILMAMAQTMDTEDVGKLEDIFLTADTEDTGTLNLSEFKHAIHKVNPSMKDDAIVKMFKGIDQDQSGEIHYAEFVAALAESHGLVTMDRLAEAFDRIDSEGKGYISHDDLRTVLGKDYDREKVNRMIEEADFKKNGQVDYDELIRLMLQDPSAAVGTVGDVTESLRSLEGFKDIAKSYS